MEQNFATRLKVSQVCGNCATTQRIFAKTNHHHLKLIANWMDLSLSLDFFCVSCPFPAWLFPATKRSTRSLLPMDGETLNSIAYPSQFLPFLIAIFSAYPTQFITCSVHTLLIAYPAQFIPYLMHTLLNLYPTYCIPNSICALLDSYPDVSLPGWPGSQRALASAT